MKNKTKPVQVELPVGPVSRRFVVDKARDKKVAIEIAAEARELAELAKFLKLPAVAFMRAKLEVAPLKAGRVVVTGKVSARVTQTCVVTLEDFEADVVEPIEMFFSPAHEEEALPAKGRISIDVYIDDEDEPPEPIINGRIDLGAVAVEFLALGLVPHPRRPDAAFEVKPLPEIEKDPSPFAALAILKPNGASDK